MSDDNLGAGAVEAARLLAEGRHVAALRMTKRLRTASLPGVLLLVLLVIGAVAYATTPG